jgi:tight adherence protein B
VTAFLIAMVAGYGAHLVSSAALFGWRGDGPGPRSSTPRPRRRAKSAIEAWLAQAGLGEIAPREFLAVLGVLFVIGAVGGAVLFGGAMPSLVLGLFAASVPVASYRARRARNREHSREAWPRLIDEIRILTGSAGRSIPQALFEVGTSGPAELRPAFEAAHRQWLLSTDFSRTLDVLKGALVDPTADATCETLLIAHELGGTDLGRRLDALAEDRRQDTQGRKDALAKQAGVRFARRFVLIVPLGMALVGLSIGNGREAYETAFGQLIVVVALGLVVICWIWAGRIMRLPDEERVFP